MTLYIDNLPNSVNSMLETVRQLNNQERLLLAKALLDSVVESAGDEETDWRNLSLTAFTSDWDNPDDAIYDNWREHYNYAS
ncbi:MAG: hypothetical protein MAG431_02075 [Chloroflexi bacterium]|nr:hypothetical protein [Chloroflexota bacterium]